MVKGSAVKEDIIRLLESQQKIITAAFGPEGQLADQTKLLEIFQTNSNREEHEKGETICSALDGLKLNRGCKNAACA